MTFSRYTPNSPPDWRRFMPKHIINWQQHANKEELFLANYEKNRKKDHDFLKEQFIYLARGFPTYGATFYQCFFSRGDDRTKTSRSRPIPGNVGINVNGVHLIHDYNNERLRDSFAFSDFKSQATSEMLQIVVNDSGTTKPPLFVETKFADLLMHFIQQFRKKLGLTK
ncbi:hypothetical protein WR25_05436 [Diploscapter pachys]|uniref:FERM domain-containing protein n=1 Tax=Diploscapter pachys TaxID=2018661 RepID=A0A2A2KTB6_9BILA|nr:hypothetical protein WR25_05436 [Diploscapter pachys]